jgi:hypothetical protein
MTVEMNPLEKERDELALKQIAGKPNNTDKTFYASYLIYIY